MEIKKYSKKYEKSWLRCRLLSFYETSYFDDVLHKKEDFDIDLVAIEGDKIIGFLQVESENFPGEVCHFGGELGGVIWNLGVHPDYQRKNIASTLLSQAILLGKDRGLTRFEVWTQDDIGANNWYKKMNFKKIKNSSYLNIFAKGDEVEDLINKNLWCRSINFEGEIDKRDEFLKKYSRVHEVFCYELYL